MYLDGMDLETLIQQPESRRDSAWEMQFLDALLPTKVDLVEEEPQTGPDGWPYLIVRTSPDGQEPVDRVVRWLAERGIGLVINPHKMVPDYVFTYGMLWNYVQTGRFVQPAAQPATIEESMIMEPGQKLVMGAPTEAYLPLSVRKIQRYFLSSQNLTEPRILVISTPDYKQVDLAISLESVGNLNSADQKSLAGALSWFLPLHYRLVVISEKGLPAFVPL